MNRALIGRTVRRLRTERGMSQQALAARLGALAREWEAGALAACLLGLEGEVWAATGGQRTLQSALSA